MPPLGAIPRDHAFEIFVLSITSNLGKIENVLLTRPKASGPLPLPLWAIKLCVYPKVFTVVVRIALSQAE